MSEPTARDLLERCQTLLTTMELTGEEGDFLNEIDAFLAESETTKEPIILGMWPDHGVLNTTPIHVQNCPCNSCEALRSKADNTALGCVHGRLVGQPCPHCLGINR